MDIDRNVGGTEHGLLQEGLIGMVRVNGGRALPLLDPKVFVSRGLLRSCLSAEAGGVRLGA